jgi:hypothetical protein
MKRNNTWMPPLLTVAALVVLFVISSNFSTGAQPVSGDQYNELMEAVEVLRQQQESTRKQLRRLGALVQQSERPEDAGKAGKKRKVVSSLKSHMATADRQFRELNVSRTRLGLRLRNSGARIIQQEQRIQSLENELAALKRNSGRRQVRDANIAGDLRNRGNTVVRDHRSGAGRRSQAGSGGGSSDRDSKSDSPGSSDMWSLQAELDEIWNRLNALDRKIDGR